MARIDALCVLVTFVILGSDAQNSAENEVDGVGFGVGVGDLRSDGGQVKWMLMPKDNGDVQVAILSGIKPRKFPDPYNIAFLLYTRDNPKEAEVRKMDPDCLPVFKNFKPNRPTKILVHGFGDSSSTSLMYPLLRDALLKRSDVNVVTVDWSELAATPWYGSAASNTVPVARHTASLIDHLATSTGTDVQHFHLIGFSLGAHVVGLTGQFVKKGKIRRITALDPAQVLFTETLPDQRLDATDADVVEVLHTSGGYLGYQSSLGHRDFFPNGGSWPQPGCVLDFVAVCSHRRAYYYYAEALNGEMAFPAFPCENFDAFVAGKCNASDTRTLDVASEDLNEMAQGTFFFVTNPQEPFAQSSPSANQV